MVPCRKHARFDDTCQDNRSAATASAIGG